MFINNMYSSYVASHNHPDDLGIAMYAYGKRHLVDPGRYGYDENSEEALWLRRTTEAHNTIEVDDTAQGYIKSELEKWISNDGYDYYSGNHYNYNDTILNDETGDNLIHNRRILFIKYEGFEKR